jgi:hypothetical protein
MKKSLKRQCLDVIWSAINSAQPGQEDVTLYCRAEDAATMIACLNIPQVRTALQSKNLTFTIKATSNEDFNIREQANVSYYALLVATTLLSKKTDRTATHWLSLLMTHALGQVQHNAGEVAKTIAQAVPVQLFPKDELGKELVQEFDQDKMQYHLLKIAKGGKTDLSIEALETIYRKLMSVDAEVNINCDLPSVVLIVCCLEKTLQTVDDFSDPWFKGIRQLCNNIKANILELVPESLDLFLDVELKK